MSPCIIIYYIQLREISLYIWAQEVKFLQFHLDRQKQQIKYNNGTADENDFIFMKM